MQHPQKGCGTEENDLSRKNLECFKKRLWCLVMMVTRQESDEIEQITKYSHCRVNFYFFISFSKEKIAYVTHTFNNKIYADSTEIRAH